ncbi:MAG: PQQ-binding-like beta-propeller repeat protein [Paludibacter sp.]|nr:PQQ-binding-like beta-propeller repeat protein [Paludibacter sp.]
MGVHSAGNYLFIISLCCLISCGNISYPHQKDVEGLKPIWSTRLPGKAGIYNDGLIGLPVYKDNIFFHSTIFTGENGEDNRIHALDLETGKINWTFPHDYDARNPMFFWGKPYLFENHMVIKMSKFEPFCEFDRIICLNLDNGDCEWKIEIPEKLSHPTCKDVGGYDNQFIFVSESEKETIIFRGDVLTGDTSRILILSPSYGYKKLELNSSSFNTIEKMNQPLFLFSTKEFALQSNMNAKESAVCLLDLKSGNLISKINIVDDVHYNVTDLVLYKELIYCISGRKVFCLNPQTGTTEWTCQSTGIFNLITTDMLIDKDVLFLWGVNRYLGLDIKSGNTIYEHEITCGNAAVFDGQVYLISRDGELYIIDIQTGEIKQKISCPENNFLTGCKPNVYENKLYVFDYFNAHCYQLNLNSNEILSEIE